MRNNARFIASLLGSIFAIGVLVSACDGPEDGQQMPEQGQQQSY